jgi:TolB-like protein
MPDGIKSKRSGRIAYVEVREGVFMKKLFLAWVLALCGTAVFAMELPIVAVSAFDVMGGITKDESQVITELFMMELVSTGAVNVVDRENFDKIIAEMKFQTSDWSDSRKTAELGHQLNATCIIRGQLMKMGNVIYMTSTLLDADTAQILYSAREQVNDLGEIYGKLTEYCSQLVSKIPMPNIFIGKWRSSAEGVVAGTCILNFLPDGTIVVERYDVSHVSIDKLTLTGSGAYSFDRSKLKISLTLKPPNAGWGSGGGDSMILARDYSSLSTEAGYIFDSSGNSFFYGSADLFCLQSKLFGYSLYRNFVKTK